MLVTTALARCRYIAERALATTYASAVIASEVDVAYAANWGKLCSRLRRISYAGPVVRRAIPAVPPAPLV